MASIMSWKPVSETAVKIDYPSDKELQRIIIAVQNLVGDKRRGFTIDINGSCCKGPQGVNWFVTVDFHEGNVNEDFALAQELIFILNRIKNS